MTPEQLAQRNAAIRKAWNDPLRLAQAQKTSPRDPAKIASILRLKTMGWTFEEIARVLGMSKTGVIKQFHRWAP